MKLTNMEAIQAQGALAELGKRDDIPFKASLDIAIISNMMDIQIKTYGEALQKLYAKCSVKATPQEAGGVQFTCFAGKEPEKDCPMDEETAKVRQENLSAFGEKLNELLGETGKDIEFQRIKLPEDINVKSETLKPITEFIEVG